MAQILLFHHALGRTEGVGRFADALRAAGHEVTVPDLFDGRIFAGIKEGVAYAQQVGFGQIIQRGVAAGDSVKGPCVYAGFSLGVLPAQALAQSRKDALAAILYFSAVAPEEFPQPWPVELPLQIHALEHDPWCEADLPIMRQLQQQSRNSQLHLYPGTGHLVTDHTGPDYDPQLAGVILQRSIEFLDQCG